MTAPISYNIADAAAATGYSTDVIRRAIKSGELVAHFPTSKGVITAEDLHAWINQAPTERRDPDPLARSGRSKAGAR